MTIGADDSQMTEPAAFTRQERIDILKCVFQQLHSMRREDEAFENRFAFAVCAVLLALCAYTLKGEVRFDASAKQIVVPVVVTMTIASIWFLVRHSRRIRVDCELIVRVEQCFGLYDEALYISKKQVEALGNTPFPAATVYPTSLEAWGANDIFLSLAPHIIAVASCGAIGVVVVWIR